MVGLRGATLPDSGMLDEAQTRTVLRLATATARAGDTARLATLRQTYGPRIGAGALGDMFRLLTAEPISTTADIMRSQREMSLAASLPAGLKAVAARACALTALTFIAWGLCGFVAAEAKRGLRPPPLMIMFRRLGPRGQWAGFRAYCPTGRLLVGRGTR